MPRGRRGVPNWEGKPTEKDKWRAKWQAAFNNMPVRTTRKKETRTTLIEEPIPIGEYIEGIAKGTIVEEQGKPHWVEVKWVEWTYGRQQLLTTLLKIPGSRAHAHNRVHAGVRDGTRPTDPELRAALERFAGKGGRKLAEEAVRKMGLAKRYGLE